MVPCIPPQLVEKMREAEFTHGEQLVFLAILSSASEMADGAFLAEWPTSGIARMFGMGRNVVINAKDKVVGAGLGFIVSNAEAGPCGRPQVWDVTAAMSVCGASGGTS